MSVFSEQQVRPGLRLMLAQIWQSCLTWSRRRDVRAALITTLALRVVCSSIAVLLTFMLARPGISSVLDRYVTNPWLHWDTYWYLGIAENGYRVAGSTPFMPLYPLLIRIVGMLLGGNYPLAALLISTVATFGALLCFYRLISRLSSVSHAADWALVTAALGKALPVSPPDGLTSRQFQVLKLMSMGLALKQIAGELGLAEKTVRNQASLMYAKLRVKDRTQAILYALQKGIA